MGRMHLVFSFVQQLDVVFEVVHAGFLLARFSLATSGLLIYASPPFASLPPAPGAGPKVVSDELQKRQ